MKNVGLILNSLSLYSIYGSRAIFLVLVIPLFVAKTGENWGVIAASLSLVQICSVAIEYGFGLSGTKRVSRSKADAEALADILYSHLCCQILILCFCLVVLAGFCLMLELSALDGLLLAALCLFQGGSPLWFLRGIERLGLYSLIEVVSKLALAVAAYVGLSDHSEIRDVLYILVFFTACSFFGGIFVSLTHVSRHLFSQSIVKARGVLTGGFPMFLLRLLGVLAASGSSVILGITGNLEAAGMVAIAERIITGIRTLILPIWDILFPRLARLALTNVETQLYEARYALWVGCGASLVAGVLLAVFSEDLTLYFLGARSAVVSQGLLCCAAIPVTAALVNGIGLSELVSKDYDLQFVISVAAGVLLHFSLLGIGVTMFSSDQQSLMYLFAVSYQVGMLVTLMFVISFVALNKSENV